MAKVITENFRVSNANEFYDSFMKKNADVLSDFNVELTGYVESNSLSISNTQIDEIVSLLEDDLDVIRPENDYYIFASSIDSETTIANTQYEKREFLRRVIFGNKINTSDLRYMLRKRDWVSGTIYDAFDDQKDVSTLDMYVTVLDGNLGEGPYRVYKCIDNNSGAASTSIPSGTELGVFQLEDGYVWKYMFEVPASEYLIYQTTQSIPYNEDRNVMDTSKEGVSDILIESTTTGLFVDYLLGSCVLSSAVTDEDDPTRKVLRVSTEFDVTTTTDYYKGMYLYFSNGGVSEIFEIVESSVPESLSGQKVLEAVVNTDFDVSTLAEQSCRVYPKVEVSKGAVEDCIAYAITDDVGTITDIQFFSRGEGYKFASASVSFPPDLNVPESSASLRIVLSPIGGHGSDPISELAMSRIMVVTNFYTDVLKSIPDTGTYTKIGLVKNPRFANGIAPIDIDNRMVLETAGIGDTETVKAGSIMHQTVNGETITGIIHEVDESTIYLVDYNGAFQGTFQAGVASVKLTEDAESSVDVTINNVSINETNGQDGNYIAYTGELLHFIDFDPVERTADRREKVKLIFDF